jgi:uncharacterized membrane protein
MFSDWFWAVFWSIVPVSELRGGIPFALSKELNPFFVYLVCVGTNALAFPIVYLFLEKLHPIFVKWRWYQSLFDKFVIRTRKKLEKQIEKYGFWGLLIFVMIPLPVTGAYTGSLAAWLFNLVPSFNTITLLSLSFDNVDSSVTSTPDSNCNTISSIWV